MFGQPGNNSYSVTGTVVKFTPVTGTDIRESNRRFLLYDVRYQCITCMEEYKTKSLEELRLEDYKANRKFGPLSVMTASAFSNIDNNFNPIATPTFERIANTSSFKMFTLAPGFGNRILVGTPIRFTPVAGVDAHTTRGISQTYFTKHQCITFMSLYKTKSLEELRLEDYTVGRKFGVFNRNIFGGTTTDGLRNNGFVFNNINIAMTNIFNTRAIPFGVSPTASCFSAPFATSSKASMIQVNSKPEETEKEIEKLKAELAEKTQKLKDAERALETHGVYCCICLTEVANRMWDRCNHLAACRRCAETLDNTIAEEDRTEDGIPCPKCRTHGKIVPVFI